MTILETLILSVVEGLTEFLPVSSTGHLILSSYLLKLEQSDFLKSFEIIIQLGAISSVVVVYFKRFLLKSEAIKRIIFASIPTAIVGFPLYGFIKNNLLSNYNVVLWALLLGGIALIAFELWYKGKEKTEEKNVLTLSYSHCFLIGLFQSVAIIPGVSRTGATILGGLSLGIPRKTIVEFSFLLAIPTMAGATGLDLIKNASLFSYDQFGILLIGFVVSFATALFAIKFMLAFVQKHTFVSFGIYRIILAIVFFTLFL